MEQYLCYFVCNISGKYYFISFCAGRSVGKKNLKLKECQYKAVKAVVVDRKDAICILPTGYGKSIIYQLLPFVLLNYLFATHAQYGRHTVFCMSITDYPRASVSFPRDRRLGERDCVETCSRYDVTELIRPSLFSPGHNFKNPIFGVFEAEYLWEYLSVRRMVYSIRIVLLWRVFGKRIVIMPGIEVLITFSLFCLFWIISTKTIYFNKKNIVY